MQSFGSASLGQDAEESWLTTRETWVVAQGSRQGRTTHFRVTPARSLEDVAGRESLWYVEHVSGCGTVHCVCLGLWMVGACVCVSTFVSCRSDIEH